jgi:ABC-type dipeptide/oligopeptide/nickel transport system ATPase subunit
MKFADKLASILKIRKNDGFTLNIGYVEEAVVPSTRLRYSWSNGGLRVESQRVNVWRRSAGRFVLRPELEPNPHIIIVGMSGYGKSTLLRGIIDDIKRGNKAAIVFDAHNEHESVVNGAGGMVYDAAHTSLNIFELDGVSIDQRISDITSLFTEVYGLGHVQASKLSSCIWCTYRKLGARSRMDSAVVRTPTVADLLAELYVFLRNAGNTTEKNTITHLIGRISLLNGVGMSKGTVSVSGLESGISSFSLAGLKNPEAQIIYISELLRRLYVGMKEKAKERGLGLYIILDEAQFLIDSSNAGGNLVAKLISEGRKYGVGVIVATHMASTLNKRIVANASAFITFYSREPSEINYVANLFAGGNPNVAYSIKDRLGRLRQNEAMVLDGERKKVMVVGTRVFRDPWDYARPAKPDQGGMLEDARRPVLREKLAAANAGLEVQINGLLEAGKLTSFRDIAGRFWVMKRSGAVSIEHEVCVELISRRLRDLGVENRVVDNAFGPDIVAYAAGKEIAIEYETGKKRIEDTARMVEKRRTEYGGVIVFVNSAAYKFYSDYFGDWGISVLDISGLYSFDFHGQVARLK